MDRQCVPVPVRKFRILGYATGDYVCNCSVCSNAFVGDKRAVMCLPCVIKLVEEKFTSTNSAIVPCPGHRKGNVCEIHAHDWLCGNVPCMLSRVEKRMSDGEIYNNGVKKISKVGK